MENIFINKRSKYDNYLKFYFIIAWALWYITLVLSYHLQL